MIVVGIIGVLLVIAIPAFNRIQRASKNSRIENDFRIYAQAFEIYNTQNGIWPEAADPGEIPQVPVSMADAFREAGWRAPTVIGGRWKWDKDTGGVGAGISIVDFTVTDAQLLEIDAKIDDGNLNTGHLQKTAPGHLTYVLAQ